MRRHAMAFSVDFPTSFGVASVRKASHSQTIIQEMTRPRQAVATAHPCSCRCDREDYMKGKDAIGDKDYMSQRITRLRMYATKRIHDFKSGCYNMNYTSHNQHLSPRDTNNQWSSHQWSTSNQWSSHQFIPVLIILRTTIYSASK